MNDKAEEPFTEHIRLQVYLARAGVCSRRGATSLIESGRVTVNQNTILQPGHRVNVKKDKVHVDAQMCTLVNTHYYFAMNKPRKVESTNVSFAFQERSEVLPVISKNTFMSATQNSSQVIPKEPKRTVKDIISRYYDSHIFSVGRLDYHSSGLLLFTTDGELCNILTHPKYEVKKVYRIETKSPIPESLLKKWREGIKILDITYTIQKYHIFSYDPRKVELTLHEGKNREIRNVCEHYHVLIKRLDRIVHGPITLGSLKPGAVRPLTKREIAALYELSKQKKRDNPKD